MILKETGLNINEIFSDYFPDKLSRDIALQLAQKYQEGNICIDLEDESESGFSISDLRKSPFLTENPDSETVPFVLVDKKMLYLHRYYSYESLILAKITEMTGFDETVRNENTYLAAKRFISDILKISDNSSKWQSVAALLPLINQLTLITGGPGTGKTTSISKFIHIFLVLFPDKRIVMAAPTGKAAVRMKESLQKYSEGIDDIGLKEKLQKIRSKTLHSLLGISKYNVSNSSNTAKKLPFDVLIVDESSMIDISLMSKLFSSVKNETRLILLGDRFQLSSIGAGSVFGDLCFSVQMNRFSANDVDFMNSVTEREFLTEAELCDPKQHNTLTSKVIELKKSYRFSDDKGIGKISKLILEGDENGLNEFYNADNPDQEVMIADDIENDFSERLLMLYDEYAAEDDISEAFVKLNRIRILCSVTNGKYSTDYFNKLIEKRLLEMRLLNPGSYFYDKQPIIINENDYNLGLFNGDTGIVRFDRETGFYNAYFQLQELKKLPCNQIKKFSTAYAMSIHKSQGSEFENVIVVLNNAGKEKFVSRELLYTAVTRAKNRIMIISEREVLEKAMKNKVSRISGIKYRLNKPASIS